MKDLNKLLGACLAMQPYDAFMYVTILPYPKEVKPEDSEDQKLAEFLIDKFKIGVDKFNGLHASKIDKDRFEIYKNQMLKVIKPDQMIQYNFRSETYGDVHCTEIHDEVTKCYLIECKDERVGYYLVY